MGIYFGESFFGFRCSFIRDEINETVYEIKFDNLDNEKSEQIIKLLSTFNDSTHIFHIYDSFIDTYDEVFEEQYMWRLIEKKNLTEYLKSFIKKNNEQHLLDEQRERCGIIPYKNNKT
jgi:hypothetical protein